MLTKYFNISNDGKNLKFESDLNYFSITTLLFYICDKKRYKQLRESLLEYINYLYSSRTDTLISDSEMVHLTLDLIACPFLDVNYKKSILDNYGILPSSVKKIIEVNTFWFTKWKDFNFAKELDSKLSNEVYWFCSHRVTKMAVGSYTHQRQKVSLSDARKWYLVELARVLPFKRLEIDKLMA